MPLHRLYLVRHPRTVLGPGYCYGSSDVAVADDTLALCRERLAALLPANLPVRSSPLQRCAGLARLLGAQDVRFDGRLQEMHFGSWELRPWDAIAWDEVEAWNRNLAHHAPGRGETLVAVAQRVWAAFDELCRGGDEQTIVVCHGGSIRMLRACGAWQAEHGAGAVPDAAGLEAIALCAAADRREVGFGEVVTLDVAAIVATTGR